MAYTRTVTVTDAGHGRFEVLIDETADVAATSETTLAATSGTTEIPYYGRIISRRSILISGTGATIDPIVAEATNPAVDTTRIILENGTPAASPAEWPAVPRTYKGGGAGMFHRSRPDAGTDNVIKTRYIILADWTD